jgi:hypothetical protein
MTDDQIARLGDIEALTRDELEAIARDPDQPADVRDHADALLAAGAAENPPAIDATGEAGARLELVRAIAAGMAEVGAVAKDGTNTKDHYSYATVEAMLRAVRGPLFARGVILLPHPRSWDERQITAKSGTPGSCVDLTIDFEFTNGAASYIIEGWKGQGIDYSDKAPSKAYTSALKTFVRVTWLLPAGAADDPDETSPDRGSSSSYGAAPQSPAWARPASDEDKRRVLAVLTELVGHRGTASAYARLLSDTADGFPVVVAKWLAELPNWQREGLKAAAAEQAPPPAPPSREDLHENAGVRTGGEAPGTPAEDDPPATMCGARQEGTALMCVLNAGHAHRGEPDHVTAQGTPFPDDERITYGTLQPVTPTPDAVDVLPPEADETPEAYLERLRAAGCICPNPLEGPKGMDDACPVRGHGIPF